MITKISGRIKTVQIQHLERDGETVSDLKAVTNTGGNLLTTLVG